MSDLSDAILGIGFIGFIILVIGFLGLGIYADIMTSEGTITVTEKIGAHGDEGQYLIISQETVLQEQTSWGDTTGWVVNKSLVKTGEDEVLTVADNWIYLKLDASDRYAALKVGKTYHVKCSGFRNHLLSWYRNIIEYQEIQI